MDDEGIGPAAAALLALFAAALGGFLAEGRRPRQRQNVEVELTRLMLALLCGRSADRDGKKKDGESRSTHDETGHETPPITRPTKLKHTQFPEQDKNKIAIKQEKEPPQGARGGRL
jgi:hypothetical protein